MSTDAERVRAAADHIEKHGLHKGTLFDRAAIPVETQFGRPEYAREHGVRCCTVGALEAYDVHTDPIRMGLAKFVGVYEEEYDGDRIPEWNDAPERTADEVVAALRSFADTLDAQPV